MLSQQTRRAPSAARPVASDTIARRLRRLWDQHLYAYALLAPTGVVVVGLILFPVLSSIDLSFHNADLIQIGKSYGPLTLANYARLIDSPELWPSLRFSVIYVVVTTVVGYAIGLGTASMLNRRFRGRGLARLVITIPWAIPLVVATNIFWWLFNKTFGIVNYGLAITGLVHQPIDWFLNANAAGAAVTITTIWKGYPFFTIMLLAGMQAIPLDLYDAAKVDGASRLSEFRNVTLPALRGVTAIALLINALWAFREFTVIYVLTGGGPVGSTETLSIWTYLEAFANLHMGFAAAIGMLTLAISVVATLVLLRMSRSDFYA